MSPEKFSSVDEIMVPYRGGSYLRQYFQMNSIDGGLKIWGRGGVFRFIHDFDVYQSRSNKSNSTFGVSGCCDECMLHFFKARKPYCAC